MHHHNSLSPDSMTDKERIGETALILAQGLLRLIATSEVQHVAESRIGEISLDNIGQQRVHSDVSTKTEERH